MKIHSLSNCKHQNVSKIKYWCLDNVRAVNKMMFVKHCGNHWRPFWKRLKKSVTFCEHRQHFDEVSKRLANVLMPCKKRIIKLHTKKRQPNVRKMQRFWRLQNITETFWKHVEELLKKIESPINAHSILHLAFAKRCGNACIEDLFESVLETPKALHFANVVNVLTTY